MTTTHPPRPLTDEQLLGYNAALEWAAGMLDQGYPAPDATASTRALAMTLRAGKKPLLWDVVIRYHTGEPDGGCVHDAQVEAVDEIEACEKAEAALMASCEVQRIDRVEAAVARRSPEGAEPEQEQVHQEKTEKNQPQGQVPSREAGRALDALVHERVMGGTVDYTLTRRELMFPYYSTDIAAAWLIAESFHAERCYVYLGSTSDGTWEARIGADRVVEAPTAPLAICRAALAAASSPIGAPDHG